MGVSSANYNIGALAIRIGFWGLLYYNYNKEPPEIVLVFFCAPLLRTSLRHSVRPNDIARHHLSDRDAKA